MGPVVLPVPWQQFGKKEKRQLRLAGGDARPALGVKGELDENAHAHPVLGKRSSRVGDRKAKKSNTNRVCVVLSSGAINVRFELNLAHSNDVRDGNSLAEDDLILRRAGKDLHLGVRSFGDNIRGHASEDRSVIRTCNLSAQESGIGGPPPRNFERAGVDLVLLIDSGDLVVPVGLMTSTGSIRVVQGIESKNALNAHHADGSVCEDVLVSVGEVAPDTGHERITPRETGELVWRDDGVGGGESSGRAVGELEVCRVL